MPQHSLDRRVSTHLQHIVDGDIHDSIKAAVAREALSHESPVSFFKDLARIGCVSGMVGSLIYYHQTHAFFDNHYAEIEELRIEFESEVQPLLIHGDLKNTLAWFAFEEVSFRLAEELNLGV